MRSEKRGLGAGAVSIREDMGPKVQDPMKRLQQVAQWMNGMVGL